MLGVGLRGREDAGSFRKASGLDSAQGMEQKMEATTLLEVITGEPRILRKHLET